VTTRLPYGSWPSPIAPELLVSGAATPSDVWAHDGVTWWSQSRPQEGGRTQIVRRDRDGSVHEVLPDGWNARTQVHEYGGAAWWVQGETVFFTAWADQRLYRLGPDDDAPVPLTPAAPDRSLRYTDGRVTPDATTVVCVRERHDADGVSNELVAVPVDGSGAAGFGAAGSGDAGTGGASAVRVLFQGTDFVAAPRVSPDGRQLAWITWDHPSMPWDSTQLWLADLSGQGGHVSTTNARVVAGGTGESLLQPEWGPDGDLYVVSDRTDWWNVYRVDLAASGTAAAGAAGLVPIYPVAAEIAEPAWVFGLSKYAVAHDAVWLTYPAAEGAQLVRAPRDGSGQGERFTVAALALDALRMDLGGPGGPRLVAIAAYADHERQVVELATTGPTRLQVLAAARDLGLPPATIARARPVTFPSAGGRTAHAWYYPPTGLDDAGAPLTGLDAELPPLIVHVHGGPTSSADPSFSVKKQFWTSRGFALIDVDYGGSSGYGRAYRQLLQGEWGVVDVEDCSAAALWTAGQGLADPHRLAISGGSAGGFTVLCCLATTSTFQAGASHYGIADLRALAEDTHKMESRYTDGLVGPLPAAEAVYLERSALSHIDGFDAPLIVFQGLEDAVVLPAQAEAIVAALAAKGVPHAYLPFEGEQHGFRIAKNILRALTAELSFYGQVFGFTPAGDLEPVDLVR